MVSEQTDSNEKSTFGRLIRQTPKMAGLLCLTQNLIESLKKLLSKFLKKGSTYLHISSSDHNSIQYTYTHIFTSFQELASLRESVADLFTP